MTITFTLDDVQFSAMKNALRISTKQFQTCLNSVGGTSEEEKLVHRILMARKALGLSNTDADCCHDWQQTQTIP